MCWSLGESLEKESKKKLGMIIYYMAQNMKKNCNWFVIEHNWRIIADQLTLFTHEKRMGDLKDEWKNVERKTIV